MYSFFFDWVTPPVAQNFKLCCFELPCRKQSSVLPQTIKQLDFCTCAFVLVLRPCHNSIRGAETFITHAKTHTRTPKVTGSERWMALLAQKNI